jgi:hypothetical protein
MKLCPPSFFRLDTADACKSTAAVAGTAFGDTGAYSHFPAGCFWHTITGSIYFNTNGEGAANYFTQPLCAGAARSPHGRRMH